MKNQQQAEREEQQRIKNLVLNYDLQQNEDQDGGTDPQPIQTHHNTNIHTLFQAMNDRRPSITTGWRDRTRIRAKDLVNSS